MNSVKYRRFPRRKCCGTYGPLILTCIAAPLIMADLTRHVLNDNNIWQWCGNNSAFPRINQTWTDDCFWSATQYVCDVPCCVPGTWEGKSVGTYPQVDLAPGEDCNCDLCTPPDQENIAHLSFIGWVFTIGCTYSGFILLAIGTLWNANITKKLKLMRKRWKELRSGIRDRGDAKNMRAAKA